jgi:hypothetical protein
MEHKIIAFIKFGSIENMTDLYENGTIYMNTIQHFRKVEDEELRGDKYEGASKIINSLPGKFKIPNIEREFNYQKLHILEAYEEVLGNIYSLYCISSNGFPNPLDFELDQKNKRFGTHCVLIKDNQYFLDSIEIELKRQGLKFRHGFVNYYNKEGKSGKLNLFEKPNEFEYQKEFRFYVEHNKIESLSIQIGSLQNCAELITIEEVLSIFLTNEIY